MTALRDPVLGPRAKLALRVHARVDRVEQLVLRDHGERIARLEERIRL
jgi:hypothetical protein